jgi:hypothetical protein
MSSGGKYHQGEYLPKNKDKYKGSFPITFRSSWEFRMMRWLDTNPAIVNWGSESTIVPYADPTRLDRNKRPTVHRYFIDFYMIVKDKTGKLTKYYIEVKPYTETIPPVKGRKKEMTYMKESVTFVRNMAKWEAAKLHARKMGGTFMILTENEIL